MKILIRMIVPAILGIIISAFVTQKLFEYYRKKAPPEYAALSIAPLDHGSLINLRTNVDESQSLKKGKILLVFLTTDCEACKKEVVTLSSLTSSTLSSKVRVYGVFVEPRDNVIPFVEENNITFPLLMDNGATVLSKLGFKYMPTKVLMQEGIVQKIWYGSSPNLAALVRDIGEEVK